MKNDRWKRTRAERSEHGKGNVEPEVKAGQWLRTHAPSCGRGEEWSAVFSSVRHGKKNEILTALDRGCPVDLKDAHGRLWRILSFQYMV
jgi:hypothetical protein